MGGDETLLKFSGVPLGEACSVVLRGATEQIIGEAERSLHDALCVLTSTVKEPRTLYGGGFSELLMARAVDELSSVTPGKEARAMTSFANALRQLPSIIAENGGYDSAQLVSELKAKHILGESTMGLNTTEGKVGCMKELGITESFSVKRQVLVQASEASEMILRVDDILKAPKAERTRQKPLLKCSLNGPPLLFRRLSFMKALQEGLSLTLVHLKVPIPLKARIS